MAVPGISKSRFVKYVECPKLGYMVCHPRRFKHLADPLDWMALHLIGEGIRVGELARERFPDGRLIGHVWDLDRARDDTAATMQDDGVAHVFEGAFAAGGLLCRVDVLKKVGDNEVDIIEVKATNGVKTEHIPDLGFQLAVLESAGLSVRSAGIMHFDPEYVHPGGEGYDLDALFTVDDVTKDVRDWVAEHLHRHLDSMRGDLAGPGPPDTPLRNACRECVYYRQVCAVGAPRHPLCELGVRRGELSAALDAAGIKDVCDVPADLPGLSDGQRLVLEAVRTGRLVFDRSGIQDLPRELEYPLWFLDFETFMPGLPIFAGMRPWQHVPFQWSLDVLGSDGRQRHEEFLQADGNDPRRAFAESLIACLEDAGSIIVYNRGMESTRLRELARDLPDLAEALLALDERVIDLLPIVRRSCYHPGFHGSRSLKVVTPVLAPHLDYDRLVLKAGTQAMEAYERLTSPETCEAERDELRAHLRTYCALDTAAMVGVLERILAEASA